VIEKTGRKKQDKKEIERNKKKMNSYLVDLSDLLSVQYSAFT